MIPKNLHVVSCGLQVVFRRKPGGRTWVSSSRASHQRLTHCSSAQTFPGTRQRGARPQNHGMVWVRRDLKGHPVPTPCHVQGHLSPDHRCLAAPMSQLGRQWTAPRPEGGPVPAVRKMRAAKELEHGARSLRWAVPPILLLKALLGAL